jgi:Zn-finger nucleic acid-binding protein
MDCPLGHGALQQDSHAGIEVAVCDICGGEWLQRDQLAALERATVNDPMVLAGTLEYDANPGERRCPSCAKNMYEFDYRANPLEIDACPDGHGYWLDGGEESRVREAIRQRARDLNRAASAEATFGGFLTKIRGQLGGKGKGR